MGCPDCDAYGWIPTDGPEKEMCSRCKGRAVIAVITVLCPVHGDPVRRDPVRGRMVEQCPSCQDEVEAALQRWQAPSPPVV